MLFRAVSILALIVLAVGLIAGTAMPARAMAPHHQHQHHHGMAADAGDPCAAEAAGHAAPCDRHHDGDHDGGAPAHRHGAADCLCVVGACDLTALPARVAAVAYGPVNVPLSMADRALPVLAHAPPLKPPRA